MSWYVIALLSYLFLINLYAALLTVYDKKMAQKHRRRISERALLVTAAAGGAPLMLVTMKRIRHKTQKKKFMIGIPLLLCLQLIFYALLVYLLLT